MKFTVMTLFPEMIRQAAEQSIMGRAIASGVLSVETVDFREYTHNKFKHVDDYPFGGGAGMVIQAAPVYECWQDLTRGKEKKPRVIYMSPKGRTFTQAIARELAAEEELIILCGHYEGIDQRALDLIVTDEISIGDYVLTGGELPAAVVMDAISRMVPGVLSNEHSGEDESFMNSLLEYPQYTRPAVWHGVEVPAILLSGHHANVDAWRRQESIRRTFERRPELLDQAVLSKKEKAFLETLRNEDDRPEPDLSRKNT